MPNILPHARVPEHGRPAEQRTVVFVVSKVGPVPAPIVAEVVTKGLAKLDVDQAHALVFDLTAQMPCPVCGCGPATCESTGCGHMCCCPDSYPLPAAALLDDGGALNDRGRDYIEEAWQAFEARREAAAELAEEQRAQELWFARLLAGDDGNPNQELGRLVVTDSSKADDWAPFAELFGGPVVFCVDELAALHAVVEARRDAAFAQRTELHLDLPDALLVDLALSAGGAR
jgi:hypothetical protein